MSSQLQPLISADEQTFIDKVIRAHTGHPGALLGILGKVQERDPHQYLPPETLRYIAAKTEIPLSRIYSVATFYALFNLQPQGDNTICICRGTACHTRGSRNLLERVRLDLGLGIDGENEKDNEKLQLTTGDQKFTLRTVACFGQCAMAPVVEVNHHICGHATERTLRREIDTIRAGD
jgi:NADH-quinone oxidoreductase subunit E